MIFLLTKNPYSLKYNSNSVGKPEVELYGVKNYELLKSGVSSVLFAKKVLRYEKYDKMFDILALHKGDLNLIDSIKADTGLYTKDILYLDDNVKYTRSDDLALNTNSIKYDIKKKMLSSRLPFDLIKKNVTTHGNSFVYDMQKGIINAKKIKTVIKVEK